MNFLKSALIAVFAILALSACEKERIDISSESSFSFPPKTYEAKGKNDAKRQNCVAEAVGNNYIFEWVNEGTGEIGMITGVKVEMARWSDGIMYPTIVLPRSYNFSTYNTCTVSTPPTWRVSKFFMLEPNGDCSYGPFSFDAYNHNFYVGYTIDASVGSIPTRIRGDLFIYNYDCGEDYSGHRWRFTCTKN